jgi:hypothetical protein
MPEDNPGDDHRPVPDPTELTTQAVNQAREYTKEKFDALRELLEQSIKLNAELCESKFKEIEEQFGQVEELRKEQKQDMKDAVDAALTSQKDAVDKSERNTEKQISQLESNVDTIGGALRQSINDNKDLTNAVSTRVTALEQQKTGAREDRSGLYSTLAIGATVILVIIAIAGFVLSRGG